MGCFDPGLEDVMMQCWILMTTIIQDNTSIILILTLIIPQLIFANLRIITPSPAEVLSQRK